MAEGGKIKCFANLFTIADATYREQLRAKFLGDAIPATSFAAGANFTGGGLKNHNMHDDMPRDGWPRDQLEWLHSDLKDVSMCLNYLITFYNEERQMHHNKIFILLWDTLVSCSL